MPLRPPLTYPQITPARLSLSSILGVGEAGGQIVVTAGSTPGCVWFGPSSFISIPQGVGSVAVTTDPPAPDQGHCLHLKVGQSEAVSISVQPSGTGRGNCV